MGHDENALGALVGALPDGRCPRCGHEIKLVEREDNTLAVTGAMPVWGSDPAIPGAILLCQGCGCGLALDEHGRPLVVDRLP